MWLLCEKIFKLCDFLSKLCDFWGIYATFMLLIFQKLCDFMWLSKSQGGHKLGMNSVIGALSGQVLLMIYSYRTRRADSEYIYSSRSKRSSQGHVKVKV